MTTSKLLWPTRLGLFATAYFPLFVIFLLVQIDVANESIEEMNALARASDEDAPQVVWSKDTVVEYLAVPSALVALSAIGGFVLWLSIKKMGSQVLGEGTEMSVRNIEDKGSEALAYASTYIIPFLFEDFDGWPRAAALLILLTVIGTVYLNSTMLAVNPLLRWFGVGLYQADLQAITPPDVPPAAVKKTLVLVREPMVDEGGQVVSESIGPKLSFAVPAPA